MTDTQSAETRVSLQHLYKIFGDDPDGAMEHVTQGLSKPDLLEQHNHVLGLSDINIDIPDGKITVIMGLSGSGKSTLIRHLNLLIRPTAGSIEVDGEDILSFGEDRLRTLRQETMSMVFQKFALLPHRTVLENAGMPLAVRGVSQEDWTDEANKWLDRVGLQGQANQHPNQLSGGMQQRVGLARALTSNAPIMLMDEAFSALDPLIRTDMQNLLLELQEELHKTVVFITHDLDEALKLADKLVILKDGFIVQQGEPQKILMNPADAYVKKFITDINRARVLRVRSVMRSAADLEGVKDTVDAEATLEDVIAQAQGDSSACFKVIRNDEVVGRLDMTDLVRALVPAIPVGEEDACRSAA
ncbi:ATP-binding cassette domain-containing protein [Thalassobaculum sp. OXR-137]|uniref:ATP-binding cassette domain-containing protein n=1 Tax=Thalassobaculum sp. OXR-137 TaxID=3100173 RepID=UPI002AC9CD77|nr:ATP-binding cassette domain-containing protein [Thalassobaculum sp. OXR-137]WPZ32375.1 ATP-binding cassette domain-containing protein [Thalassobaculum sp. OXR-137]